jgi:hypothetical protein
LTLNNRRFKVAEINKGDNMQELINKLIFAQSDSSVYATITHEEIAELIEVIQYHKYVEAHKEAAASQERGMYV